MLATEILVSVGNALLLQRNENEHVKNITCMHVCMHVSKDMYKLSL